MSELRYGKIRLSNNRGSAQRAYDAALAQAWSTVAEGEHVFDLILDGGQADLGNDAVMVWSYSFQVVGPGESASGRVR